MPLFAAAIDAQIDCDDASDDFIKEKLHSNIRSSSADSMATPYGVVAVAADLPPASDLPRLWRVNLGESHPDCRAPPDDPGRRTLSANTGLVYCNKQHTSPVRASSIGGPSSPGALAVLRLTHRVPLRVLRLMASSIFVTCCTGRIFRD